MLPAAFRPAIKFANGLMYVSFSIADLTASPAAYCIAITNKTPSKFFVGPSVRTNKTGELLWHVAKFVEQRVTPCNSGGQLLTVHFLNEKKKRCPYNICSCLVAIHPNAQDVDDLIVSMHAMDCGQSFRKRLGSLNRASYISDGSRSQLGSVASGGLLSEISVTGQRVILLLQDNQSTQLAIQLLKGILKPGKDLLHLVTVVQSSQNEKAGHDLCKKFEILAMETLVETKTHVLVWTKRVCMGLLIDNIFVHTRLAVFLYKCLSGQGHRINDRPARGVCECPESRPGGRGQ